jgi:hypothetical protein
MGAIDSLISNMSVHSDGGLSQAQNDAISKMPDGDAKNIAIANAKLSNLSEISQAMSNMLKILHEMNQGIIQNMR